VCLEAANRASRDQTKSSRTDSQRQKLNGKTQHRENSAFFRKLLRQSDTLGENTSGWQLLTRLPQVVSLRW
jgi:hypothetical protein